MITTFPLSGSSTAKMKCSLRLTLSTTSPPSAIPVLVEQGSFGLASGRGCSLCCNAALQGEENTEMKLFFAEDDLSLSRCVAFHSHQMPEHNGVTVDFNEAVAELKRSSHSVSFSQSFMDEAVRVEACVDWSRWQPLRPPCLKQTSSLPHRVILTSTLWTTWRSCRTMRSLEIPFTLTTSSTMMSQRSRPHQATHWCE